MNERTATLMYNAIVLLEEHYDHEELLEEMGMTEEEYKERFLTVVFELHTYSSLSEVFINHYEHCLDNCDKAIVFYDPHAVAIKKLEMMSDERIVEGFARKDICVVHSKDELLQMLEDLQNENVVAGFMSSGDFNGLTTEDLRKIKKKKKG